MNIFSFCKIKDNMFKNNFLYPIIRCWVSVFRFSISKNSFHFTCFIVFGIDIELIKSNRVMSGSLTGNIKDDALTCVFIDLPTVQNRNITINVNCDIVWEHCQINDFIIR